MAIIHSRENIANVTFVRPLRPGNYIYSPNRVANSTSSERLPFMAFGIDHAGTRVDALIPHLNSGCCALSTGAPASARVQSLNWASS